MKGVVFNLLEECVRREYGEDTWDNLLDAAGLEGAYNSLGTYDDVDLLGLVTAASEALGVSGQEILRWFGRNAIPAMASRYPGFFDPHRSTLAFVLTLNDIIHPEVRKVYPGADVPEFDFDTVGDVLVMGYHSRRRMCAFAHGLIEGAAAHYGETATFEQPQCMHRGDEKCVFHLSFQPAEPAASV